MKKDKIIVIGAEGMGTATRIAIEKLLQSQKAIIFLGHGLEMNERDVTERISKMIGVSTEGTKVYGPEIAKTLEDVPRENKPRPLSEILKEDPKPFVLQNYHKHNLEPYIHEENHGPIGAILGNKKRGRK